MLNRVREYLFGVKVSVLAERKLDTIEALGGSRNEARLNALEAARVSGRSYLDCLDEEIERLVLGGPHA